MALTEGWAQFGEIPLTDFLLKCNYPGCNSFGKGRFCDIHSTQQKPQGEPRSNLPVHVPGLHLNPQDREPKEGFLDSWTFLFVAAVCFLAVACFFLWITQVEAKRIEIGMTELEVERILGEGIIHNEWFLTKAGDHYLIRHARDANIGHPILDPGGKRSREIGGDQLTKVWYYTEHPSANLTIEKMRLVFFVDGRVAETKSDYSDWKKR